MLEAILNNFAMHVKEKIADVIQDVKTTHAFEDVETVVAGLADDVATALVQGCLHEVLRDPEFLAVMKQRGTQQGLKYHGCRAISVYVYTGRRVTIWSPYFVNPQKKRGRKKAGPNGRGCHLGLVQLGFVGRGSGAFVSWVVKMAVLVPSYAIAREVLIDRGITLAVNSIRRWCRELGRLGLAHRGAISLTGQEDVTGATLVIEVDGGRVRLRTPKRGRKARHQKRQGYHAPWKEPKLFTMYLVDAHGQIRKDFLPLHDATTGDDEAVFDVMATYLKQIDCAGLARVVACGDGARWIWRRMESLLTTSGVPAAKITQVVDYTHAKQNLQEIVDLASAKQQKRLMKKWKALLFNGEIDGLGQAIRSVLRGEPLQAGIKKWEDYFVRNAQRMQYRAFQTQHLPCGSGHVESAIRRVINLRLKAPGTFWTQDMAGYFLFLRSQLLSGRWRIFMKNVRRRGVAFAENSMMEKQCATL